MECVRRSFRGYYAGEKSPREIGINKGVSTLDGKPAPYICIGTADFGSAEDLKRGMATHADEILADIPKYTDIEPEIQISEILMSG